MSDRVPGFVEGMRNAAQRGASPHAAAACLCAPTAAQARACRPRDAISASMRELLDRSLGGTISLVTEFAPDLWPVQVDPSELELVLLNLAFNARDAMPSGGTITAARRKHLPRTRRRSRRLCPSHVADTGTGMPPDVAARAFEPFFHHQGNRQGFGARPRPGLRLCPRIGWNGPDRLARSASARASCSPCRAHSAPAADWRRTRHQTREPLIHAGRPDGQCPAGRG